MIVNTKKDGVVVLIYLTKTAYYPTYKFTLVSNNNLKKQGIIWD